MEFVNIKRFAGLALFICYIALLGGILAHFSIGTHPRFLNQEEAVASQQATLDRRPFILSGVPTNYSSWRSRIFIPYAIKGLANLTGIRFSQSYVLVRFISACLALAAFSLLAARHANGGNWYGAASAGFFALTFFPTFLYIYETPTDFSDAFFFAVLTLLALEKRRLPFALVLLVGMTNRESAIFALVVWFVIHAVGSRHAVVIREAAYCAVLGALASVLIAWLRVSFAVRPDGQLANYGLAAIAQPFTWHIWWGLSNHMSSFLLHPYFGSPIFYLLGYTVFFTALLWGGRHQLPPPVRRAAVAAAGIFIFSVPFANLPEIRVYIPSLVIVTFAAVVLLRQKIRVATIEAEARVGSQRSIDIPNSSLPTPPTRED